MSKSTYLKVNPGRILLTRLTQGQKIPQDLEAIVKESGITFGIVFGIGGLAWADIGVYIGPKEPKYKVKRIKAEGEGALEAAPIIGVTLRKRSGEYTTHLHVTVAKSHSEVYSGHLIEAEVKPSFEVYVIEFTGQLTELQQVFPRLRE